MVDMLHRAVLHRKKNKRFVQKIKSKRKSELDRMFHQVHEQVFSKINCLDCANCCITTGPRITSSDITRISKSLHIKTKEFIQKYLRIDEDDDYVFQTLPCPFLGADKACMIYEARPKACRQYPHTDSPHQKKMLNLHLKNAEICPAVAQIFELLR